MANASVPRGLQKRVRALDVGGQEGGRTGDGTVHVCLGGEIDDRLHTLSRIGHRIGVLDCPLDEPDVVQHVVQVLPPPGVGQLVQHGDLISVLTQTQTDKRGADEAGAPADQELHTRTALKSSMP
jgi:hypothetical protein